MNYEPCLLPKTSALLRDTHEQTCNVKLKKQTAPVSPFTEKNGCEMAHHLLYSDSSQHKVIPHPNQRRE